jgi:Flp pilus assembly protein TadD
MKTSMKPGEATRPGLVRGRRAEELARWAIRLAVLSTVVFLPGALDRWVFPKELVLIAACVLISLVASKGRLPVWLWILFAAATVLLVTAALAGEAPLAQLLGRWPRYEGVVTISVYVSATWLGARALGPATGEPRLADFRSVVSVAALLLGLVSMLEALGFRPIPSDLERPGALLGNATDQGIVGVMFFALLVVPTVRYWLPFDRQKRAFPVLPAAGVIGALVSAVSSASRAAIIALVVVIAALAVVELVRSVGTRRRVVVVTSSLLALSALFVALAPLAAARLSGASPLSAGTVADRVINWKATMALVAEHPLIGVGPSGFVDAITPKLGPDWYAIVTPGTTLDSPHNWILQALAAGGVPLGLLALGTAGTVSIVGFRRWRAAVSAKPYGRADQLAGTGLALIGFAIALLTHFTSPGTTILAALLVGSLVALPPKTMLPTVRAELVQYLRTAGFVLGASVFALLSLSEVALQNGTSAIAQGRVVDAQNNFSQAIALRPWDADAASIAAQLFAAAADRGSKDSVPLAIDWANRSLSGTPNSVPALMALAVGQQYAGSFAEARVTLVRAQTLAPLDGAIALRLGGVLVLLGDFPSAETQLTRAASLLPSDPGPWRALEYLYEKTGRPQLAGEASARAASLNN